MPSNRCESESSVCSPARSSTGARRLEAQLLVGVVDHVLPHALLAAAAQADHGRPPDEVGRDRLLEPLELVRVDGDGQVRRQGRTCSPAARVSGMGELTDFALIVLLVAGAFLARDRARTS